MSSNSDITEFPDLMYSERMEQFGDVPFHLSVDLDSTLADTRHRQGIIEKYTSKGLPVDWDEYARSCLKDGPTPFAFVLQQIQYAIPWHVVSGRSQGALAPTLEWLKKYRLFPKSVNLEDDPTRHSQLGHVEWKVQAVLRLAEYYPIKVHVDDWAEVSWALEDRTGGKIRGLAVTPPGMIPTIPTEGSIDPLMLRLSGGNSRGY